MEQKITVRIDSSRPIFIEADANSFGQIFAGLSDEEQVNVLRSMVEHMKPHKIQWDYIAIALEKDENRQVRDDLSVIFPTQHELLAAIAAKDAEIEAAQAEINRLRGLIEESVRCLDGEPEYHDQGMGCGLEDRGITDRYEAMSHGWEQAMERVYGENIAWAKEALASALNPKAGA